MSVKLYALKLVANITGRNEKQIFLQEAKASCKSALASRNILGGTFNFPSNVFLVNAFPTITAECH